MAKSFETAGQDEFRIFVNFESKLQELNTEFDSFMSRLFTGCLEPYRKKRKQIGTDPMISVIARDQNYLNLKEAAAGQLEGLVKTAVSLTEEMKKKLAEKMKPFTYSSGTPVLDELKLQEVRAVLRSLKDSPDKNEAHILNLYMAEATPDVVFYGIKNSPLPMVTDDMLRIGFDARIQRTAPEVIDELAPKELEQVKLDPAAEAGSLITGRIRS